MHAVYVAHRSQCERGHLCTTWRIKPNPDGRTASEQACRLVFPLAARKIPPHPVRSQDTRPDLQPRLPASPALSRLRSPTPSSRAPGRIWLSRPPVRRRRFVLWLSFGTYALASTPSFRIYPRNPSMLVMVHATRCLACRISAVTSPYYVPSQSFSIIPKKTTQLPMTSFLPPIQTAQPLYVCCDPALLALITMFWTCT